MVIANGPILMPAAIVSYEIILFPFSFLFLLLLPLLFLFLPFLFFLRRRRLLLGPPDEGVTVWLINYGTYEYISFRSFLLLYYQYQYQYCLIVRDMYGI
jgi:hypothetical protein